jgi:hypothetical protein
MDLPDIWCDSVTNFDDGYHSPRRLYKHVVAHLAPVQNEGSTDTQPFPTYRVPSALQPRIPPPMPCLKYFTMYFVIRPPLFRSMSTLFNSCLFSLHLTYAGTSWKCSAASSIKGRVAGGVRGVAYCGRHLQDPGQGIRTLFSKQVQ